MANILVVDDEPDIRTIVGQVLREAGYGVCTAANGLEALNRMREQLPDGILLDLQMPVMDGKAFLSACRTNPAYANLPVALFTTSIGTDGLAEKMDVQALIAKPFDLDSFTDAVQRLVPQFPTALGTARGATASTSRLEPAEAHACAVEHMRCEVVALRRQIHATRRMIERGHKRIAACQEASTESVPQWTDGLSLSVHWYSRCRGSECSAGSAPGANNQGSAQPTCGHRLTRAVQPRRRSRPGWSCH